MKSDDLAAIMYLVMFDFSKWNPKILNNYPEDCGMPYQLFMQTHCGYTVSFVRARYSPIVKLKAFKHVWVYPDEVPLEDTKAEEISIKFSKDSL